MPMTITATATTTRHPSANGAITPIIPILAPLTAIMDRNGLRVASLLVRAPGMATDGVTQATMADAIGADGTTGTGTAATAIAVDMETADTEMVIAVDTATVAIAAHTEIAAAMAIAATTAAVPTVDESAVAA